METLTVAFAATCPVLFGRRSLSAFGLTRVDVTRKNMRSRNTMSVIDDIENPASTFVVRLMAISSPYLSEGSFRMSINSIVVLSIIKTRLEMRDER